MSILKAIARKILSEELQSIQSVVVAQEKDIKALKDENRHWHSKYAELQLAKPPSRVSFRLSRSIFDDFRKNLPQMLIGSSTTDLQAAALVAQQRVVNLIEEQLVDERG